MICWDRGRPARSCPQARNYEIKYSRFALIAGGTPAVPAIHLTGGRASQVAALQIRLAA